MTDSQPTQSTLPSRPSRRTALKAGAITVFGAGLPFSGAQAQNRYAKYAGKTVVFRVPAHPHYDAMMKILPQFTKDTGIKVEKVHKEVQRAAKGFPGSSKIKEKARQWLPNHAMKSTKDGKDKYSQQQAERAVRQQASIAAAVARITSKLVEGSGTFGTLGVALPSAGVSPCSAYCCWVSSTTAPENNVTS